TARRRTAAVKSSGVEPADELHPCRTQVLWLAEAARLDAQHIPLHRPAESVAGLGTSLRRSRIQATPVFFRSRYLGNCTEAEGAVAEFVSIPEGLCRSAGHRLGA